MEIKRGKCCETCAFWRSMGPYEGVCTSSNLGADVDLTEARYVCDDWLPYHKTLNGHIVPDFDNASDMRDEINS